MRYLPEDEEKQVENLLARGVLHEVPILCVESYVDELTVFDLQVEGDSSFIADGFVVHNSKICRFMHGRDFSVERAMQRFDEVERAPDPEAISDLQPWMRVGADPDGNQVLFYERGGRRHVVAHVDEPAVGRADQVGRYSHALTNDQLEAAGVSVPPLHGRCRSTIVVEG
jgi:hypothetical protein